MALRVLVSLAKSLELALLFYVSHMPQHDPYSSPVSVSNSKLELSVRLCLCVCTLVALGSALVRLA